MPFGVRSKHEKNEEKQLFIPIKLMTKNQKDMKERILKDRNFPPKCYLKMDFVNKRDRAVRFS